MQLLFEDERILAIAIVIAFLTLHVLGQYLFHAITKGDYFREWERFKPLDFPDPASSYMRKTRKTIFNLLHEYIKNKYDWDGLLDTDIENIMNLFNRHYSISSRNSKRNMEWEVLTRLIFNDANSNMDFVIKEYKKSLV